MNHSPASGPGERGGSEYLAPTQSSAAPLSSCPSCFRAWQDQAELNLRISAAFETLAVRIAELNMMNAEHVERITELAQVVEYLHEIVDNGGGQ